MVVRSSGSFLKAKPWHSTDLEMAEVGIKFWASAFQGKERELGLKGPAPLTLIIFYDVTALVKALSLTVLHICGL